MHIHYDNRPTLGGCQEAAADDLIFGPPSAAHLTRINRNTKKSKTSLGELK